MGAVLLRDVFEYYTCESGVPRNCPSLVGAPKRSGKVSRRLWR